MMEKFSDKEGRIGHVYEEATYFRYVLVVMLYFGSGLMGLATSFLLVVTSEEIVELVLNFTAIEFISLLDNVAFDIAEKGFLGVQNKEAADKVAESRFQVNYALRWSPKIKFCCLLILLLTMMGCWAWAFFQQFSGALLAHSLVVQFDDSFRQDLGSYSGIFVLQKDRTMSRARYHGERGGTIGYCELENQWEFYLEEESELCANAIVISSKTVSYNILEVKDENWYGSSEDTPYRFQPTDFVIDEVCVDDIDCSNHGVCNRERSCSCGDGWYGIRCQFPSATLPCPQIEIDQATGEFNGQREYAESYQIVLHGDGATKTATSEPTLDGQSFLKFYDHPVYAGLDRSGESLDVIMYTGLRWSLFHVSKDIGSDRKALAKWLSNITHTPNGFFDTTEFLGEPIWFNTADDQGLPVSKSWRFVRAGVESAVSAILLCAFCDDKDNLCNFENKCVEGKCECAHREQGRLCQIPPIADGHCDR